MFDILMDDSVAFKAFTVLHSYPLLLLTFLFTGITYIAKTYLNERQQVLLGTSLAVIPLLCVMSRMTFTMVEGIFTIQEELPLHLCRLLAVIMPVVMYTKNEKWLGITYFLIIVGTLQALLTPDLALGPPHYSYFIYWTLHGVLVYLPIYSIFVYGFLVTKRHFILAVIYGNLYMLSTLIINYFIGSNYFYTSHKPPTASLLDLMGPWPIYILVVEVLAILLFVIAYLPFMWSNRKWKTKSV